MFRSVALNSCLAKVFEKCVFKYVFKFLKIMPADCAARKLTNLNDDIDSV